ncbi:MAG: hypothetical protein H8E71_08345 [Candidatus Marinimicrobia bacterium]|nr:hypothetical protein [Candidatus Neomarinimicrobiota bacterium]
MGAIWHGLLGDGYERTLMKLIKHSIEIGEIMKGHSNAYVLKNDGEQARLPLSFGQELKYVDFNLPQGGYHVCKFDAKK